MQRGEQRDQRGRGRRVGDRAAPAAGEREAGVEPERVGEAVEQGLLHLGARRVRSTRASPGCPGHPTAGRRAARRGRRWRGSSRRTPGCCQCRVAGATTRSTASSRVASGCGCSGSRSGSPARTCPGATSGRTGRSGSARPVGRHPVDDGVAQPAELVGIEVGHPRSLNCHRLRELGHDRGGVHPHVLPADVLLVAPELHAERRPRSAGRRRRCLHGRRTRHASRPG